MILPKIKTTLKSKFIEIYSMFNSLEYFKDQNIYVVITIDTEQDVNNKYVNQGTYKNVEYGLPKIIDIFDRYNCKGTFLVTPDTICNNIDFFKDIMTKHEIGCHIHPEFFTMENINNIRHKEYLCNFTYKKQKEMIIKGTKIIEDNIHYRPVSFRAGRFGINKYTVCALAKEGYLVDTSCTPYIDWGVDHGPCFSRIKNRSFFIHNKYGKLLEIPITIINLFGIKYWLRPSISTENMAKKIALFAQEDFGYNDMTLNIMFHSMESISPNPYCMSEELIYRLEDILQYLYIKDCQFVKCKELYNIVEKNYG